MNFMGQAPIIDQWTPSWGQIKMFDGKDSLGMDYTVVESYLESMWQMTDDICGKNNNSHHHNQSKITSDSTTLSNNHTVSSSGGANAGVSEKNGFEESVVSSPLIYNNYLYNQSKITSDSTTTTTTLSNNHVLPTIPCGDGSGGEKNGFEESVVSSPLINNSNNSSSNITNTLSTNKYSSNEFNNTARSIDIGMCLQDHHHHQLFTNVFADASSSVKEEPFTTLNELTHQASVGWGTRPSPMHFDSLRVVSEHLVERIKLEDSVFRDVLQNVSSCQMYTATTTSSSAINSLNASSQCNVTGINPCVVNSSLQGKLQSDLINEVPNGSLVNKERYIAKQTKNNINRNMNSNFMCTTMFLMNESLQQNNAHQTHNTNNVKKHDLFNIACEKGCNCEATNSIFRSSNSLMFAADKHVGAKHFMTPCGPLQLTAQECGEFLLKKASVSNNIVSDPTHIGHQNINSNNNNASGQQKGRHLGVDVNDVQQTNNGATKMPHVSGHKYRADKERPFSCQECGKSFLLKHHLVTHARVHTGERPHVCPECGKSFAHKHCLSTHLLLHSSDRPYKCMECKKSFTLKHHLVTHARVHSRDRPFICQECGRTFPQKRHLVTHAKFHSGERPYVCEECGESFSQKDHLVIHSRFHGGQQPYACPDCGSTFARKFELVNHGRLHGRIPHACEVCGKEFLQKRTLLAHTRLHTGDERPFVCQHCGETFTRKPELIEHSKIHTGDKPFICRECGNCFSSREGLALHYRLHAGDRNVVADLCGLASALQQPAAHFLCQPQHQPIVNKLSPAGPLGGPGGNTGGASGGAGGASGGSGSSTTSAASMGHTLPKPKPYVCTDCGKCFTQKHGLAQHNKRHSGGGCEIRQHVCEKCGKAFFQKNHLALHSRQHMEHPSGTGQDAKSFEVLIPAPGE